jgi:hypothetical protein
VNLDTGANYFYYDYDAQNKIVMSTDALANIQTAGNCDQTVIDVAQSHVYVGSNNVTEKCYTTSGVFEGNPPGTWAVPVPELNPNRNVCRAP